MHSSIKVVVMGASGQTGQQLVKQLVTAGYSVTAFARTPSKVETYGGKVRIVQGDARSLAAVTEAVRGQDAVFSAVAQRYFKKDDLQTVYMKNLVKAMESEGVSRLINLSAWGATDSAPQATLLFKLARYTILRNVFDDKRVGEEAIMASSLDYTFARPGILSNGPARGNVKASLTKDHLKPRISRADVAAFMIEQLNDNSWHRKSPLIGY